MTSQSASGVGATTSAAARSAASPPAGAATPQYPCGGTGSPAGSASCISGVRSVPSA
jgi:hypothetical protein